MSGTGVIAKRNALLAQREELRKGRHWSDLSPAESKADEATNAQIRDLNRILFGDTNEDGLRAVEAEEKRKAAEAEAEAAEKAAAKKGRKANTKDDDPLK